MAPGYVLQVLLHLADLPAWMPEAFCGQWILLGQRKPQVTLKFQRVKPRLVPAHRPAVSPHQKFGVVPFNPAGLARRGWVGRRHRHWLLALQYLVYGMGSRAIHLNFVHDRKLKTKLLERPLALLLRSAGSLPSKLIAREGDDVEPLISILFV